MSNPFTITFPSAFMPSAMSNLGLNLQKDEEESLSKPLEEEPLLAARIVIEDCMCLLLDVDDIDRVMKHRFTGREDAQSNALRHRRNVLLDALANSLRLPHRNTLAKPKLNAKDGTSGQDTDAVLRRLSGIPKGRKLLARVLR